MDLHDWFSRARVFSVSPATWLLVVFVAILTCWLGVTVMIAQRLRGFAARWPLAPIPERLAGVTIDLATKKRRERRWMDDFIVTAPARCSPTRHGRPRNDSRPDRLAAMGRRFQS